MDSIDGQKIYLINEEGTLLSKFIKPYQPGQGKFRWEVFNTKWQPWRRTQEDPEREKKDARVLKAVGIEKENVVEGEKRERKKKKTVFDI